MLLKLSLFLKNNNYLQLSRKNMVMANVQEVIINQFILEQPGLGLIILRLYCNTYGLCGIFISHIRETIPFIVVNTVRSAFPANMSRTIHQAVHVRVR